MNAPSPPPAYRVIAERIEQAVLSGELRPGDHLPSERELVEQYGVSRPTVREALRVLQSNHVVESRLGDRRGPVVLPLSSAPLERALKQATALSGADLSSLLQFRMVISSAAAVLAAHHRDDEELAALERANARMRASVGTNPVAFGEADLEFHKVLAKASRNTLLELVNEAVRGAVLSLMEQKIASASDSRVLMQSLIHHHEEMLDAIRRRDGKRAAWLTRDDTYWHYVDFVEPEQQEALRALADEVKPQ
ncbi:FadR family transcriptional regulator [Microbacterium esteraromaticum]|uniref:FadR/GntR family transcriptional regulator n=1 Tax=Microbacterium esteraromaticum TaxID=57043 RepID=UPI001CD40EE8|nr:FadR/GntR family transcriptional regulator [Microbacterium esteraromaticum]MCA1305618.1 FadR family transcriptional regulator [Microbacterium esteraromaticum]